VDGGKTSVLYDVQLPSAGTGLGLRDLVKSVPELLPYALDVTLCRP
jgi:hypothetical protein